MDVSDGCACYVWYVYGDDDDDDDDAGADDGSVDDSDDHCDGDGCDVWCDAGWMLIMMVVMLMMIMAAMMISMMMMMMMMMLMMVVLVGSRCGDNADDGDVDDLYGEEKYTGRLMINVRVLM